MTTWANIKVCRICSSPAEYDLYGIIPAYLHSNPCEIVNWQKPLSILIEETTGLKLSPDDGLPRNICALCISYLKHAANFRDQAINNSLSLKAILMLQQMPNIIEEKMNMSKEKIAASTKDLEFLDERRLDTNLLLGGSQQDQDKVCKQLISNFATSLPIQQSMEQQMHYLYTLFKKRTKCSLREKRDSDEQGADLGLASGGDTYADDEFQTATSSEDNDDRTVRPAQVFGYDEKNFEEDDVMEVDALRETISINIPESCKERKCRACYRRFMFDESFKEHMDNCIEYKFVLYIEDVNRLLDIRRKKSVSPHEFIRRMIFLLRKTCEWVKSSFNDGLMPDLSRAADMVGPDTVESSDSSRENPTKSTKERQPVAVEKPSKASEMLIPSTKKLLVEAGKVIVAEKLPLAVENLPTAVIVPNRNKLTDSILEIIEAKEANGESKPKDLTLELIRNNILTTPTISRSATPITPSNNILIEIERSQSRNSNQSQKQQIRKYSQSQQHELLLHKQELETEKQQQPIRLLQGAPLDANSLGQSTLMKPIPLLGTTLTATNSPVKDNSVAIFNDKNECLPTNKKTERRSFLEKLHQAYRMGCSNSSIPKALPTSSDASTPLIKIRKDLHSPKQSEYIALRTSMIANSPYSAICNACNIIFEFVSDLELHNAENHNALIDAEKCEPIPIELENEKERERIIALFEEDEV